MLGSGMKQALGAAFLLAAAPVLISGTTLTANMDDRLLAAHNRERSTAGIPALGWSEELEASAKLWADHLARSGAFEHSNVDPNDSDPEGENLWAGTRGHYAPEAMVGLWIAEREHFKPGRFPANSKTGRVADVGHYTQLMWRRSSHVGCAVAAGAEDDVLVCRYTQAGNVEGERPF
jgi:hypothetical protein